MVEPRAAAAEWFVDARFGLFIHWGLYALPARSRDRAGCRRSGSDTTRNCPTRSTSATSGTSIPTCTTRTRGPPKRTTWGMRYVVATTKHHDGFCLWDSDLTGYKAPCTPGGP
jgi:alpha-L-fucosidase